MKRLAALFLCCLLLSGCASNRAEAALPTFTTVETTTPEITVAETAGMEYFLTVYAPNEDATGFIYTSMEVPEYSADVICEALIEAGVLQEDVKFNSLTVENRQIKLDVNNAFQHQLMSYGTAGEYMMMGSVVNTLLGPYDAESVFITCEGAIMESGHVIYDFPQTPYE